MKKNAPALDPVRQSFTLGIGGMNAAFFGIGSLRERLAQRRQVLRVALFQPIKGPLKVPLAFHCSVERERERLESAQSARRSGTPASPFWKRLRAKLSSLSLSLHRTVESQWNFRRTFYRLEQHRDVRFVLSSGKLRIVEQQTIGTAVELNSTLRTVARHTRRLSIVTKPRNTQSRRTLKNTFATIAKPWSLDGALSLRGDRRALP